MSISRCSRRRCSLARSISSIRGVAARPVRAVRVGSVMNLGIGRCSRSNEIFIAARGGEVGKEN